jgi:hypothetical protein
MHMTFAMTADFTLTQTDVHYSQFRSVGKGPDAATKEEEKT